MFCILCGNELPDQAKFCPSCGTPVLKEAEVNSDQRIGTLKGQAVGTILKVGVQKVGASVSSTQEIGTLESGGAAVGVVIGEKGSPIHIGGQQQYGDTVHGPKKVVTTGGGAHIGGNVNTGGGDFVGRDRIVQGNEIRANQISSQDLQRLFEPLMKSILEVPASNQPDALNKAEELKQEVAKGNAADDSKMGKLIDGLIGLVPSAVTGIASIFASPILGGLAGPVTQFILDKIQGKSD